MLGIPPASAQVKEQFIPLLVYRTGPYAPNGTPWANGKQDYLKLVNERDGGINGVKLTFEECETGYATDKGVECYERLKSKGPTGATAFDPQSTGITFALTEKVQQDKIPLITPGYGRSEAADGGMFRWNFPLLGTYWTGADILVQFIGKKEGGLTGSRARRSPWSITTRLTAKSRSHCCRSGRAARLRASAATGDSARRRTEIDVAANAAVEAGLRHSLGLGHHEFHRAQGGGGDRLPAGPDVRRVLVRYGARRQGRGPVRGRIYRAQSAERARQDTRDARHRQIRSRQGAGTGPKEEIGSILYNNGMLISMLTVEAVRRAQERFGKGKPMTGEQVRWGLENLALDQKKLDALGFGSLVRPISTSCVDHMGTPTARVQTWDGTKWNFVSPPIEADMSLIKPMIKAAADKYAVERKLARRSPADCQSDAMK